MKSRQPEIKVPIPAEPGVLTDEKKIIFYGIMSSLFVREDFFVIRHYIPQPISQDSIP